MKNFIVVFSDKGARIVKGINPEHWKNIPNVAVNPNLSKVKGIPPHHWKLQENQVVPDLNNSKPQEKIYSITVESNYTRNLILMSLGTSLLVSLLINLIF